MTIPLSYDRLVKSWVDRSEQFSTVQVKVNCSRGSCFISRLCEDVAAPDSGKAASARVADDDALHNVLCSFLRRGWEFLAGADDEEEVMRPREVDCNRPLSRNWAATVGESFGCMTIKLLSGGGMPIFLYLKSKAGIIMYRELDNRRKDRHVFFWRGREEGSRLNAKLLWDVILVVDALKKGVTHKIGISGLQVIWPSSR